MEPKSSPQVAVRSNPWQFALCVLKGFRASQGLLLSGAIAYYTLLSIIPLFTLLLLALSHIVDETRLLATLAQFLELVVPGESDKLMGNVKEFLANRHVVGWVLGGILLFFSSMAFTVLENAMSVIFFHRVAVRRRHFLISALLPYLYIILLGLGFVVVTTISGALQAMKGTHVDLLGHDISLGWLSVTLLYLIGLGGQILVLTSIYMVMPVGRLSLRRALIGGVTAGLLWEITRHFLIWYFSTLSVVNVVYGSLATTIVALLTLEVAAIILLFGAQVIAEFERIGQGGKATDAPLGMRLKP